MAPLRNDRAQGSGEVEAPGHEIQGPLRLLLVQSADLISIHLFLYGQFTTRLTGFFPVGLLASLHDISREPVRLRYRQKTALVEPLDDPVVEETTVLSFFQ